MAPQRVSARFRRRGARLAALWLLVGLVAGARSADAGASTGDPADDGRPLALHSGATGDVAPARTRCTHKDKIADPMAMCAFVRANCSDLDGLADCE